MKNLKNFGITFAVSLVVLGIIAVFACGYVGDTVVGIFNNKGKELEEIIGNASTDSAAETAEPKDERFTRELNGSSFTWLMVVTDKRTDVYDNYYPTAGEIKDNDKPGILGREYRLAEAAAIAIVRADVDMRDYVILTIPPITKIETASGEHTLGEAYALYGIDYLSQKLGSMTGLKVDYYTVMNCTELTSLASAVGAIECDIPVKICFDGKEYVSAPPEEESTEGDSAAATDAESTSEEEKKPELTEELDAANGVKLSKKLQAALLYRDWSDGIEQEMTILNSFVRGLLSNLSSRADSSLQSVLTGLKGKITTNITSADITSCGEVIRAYSWMGRQSATYPGRMFTAGEGKQAYYSPDINKAMEFFYSYR